MNRGLAHRAATILAFVEPLFEQPRKKLPPVLPEFPPTEYPLFVCLLIFSIGHSSPKASQLSATMLNILRRTRR